MKEELLKKVEELDEEYFGKRSLPRLISALRAQVESMIKEPTATNVRKQIGDVLFLVVSVARNKNWSLEELLADVIEKVENRRKSRHYYEAHVTIEPVFDKHLEDFKKICERHQFHVAVLLMQKRKKETAVRSDKDSFCTGRSISYSDIKDRMLELVLELKKAGFKVWRYKIESTLLDSRYDDSDSPLDKDTLPERERTPRPPAQGALKGRASEDR